MQDQIEALAEVFDGAAANVDDLVAELRTEAARLAAESAADTYRACARQLRALIAGERSAEAEYFGAEGEPTDDRGRPLRDHSAVCVDDDGKVECVCSLAVDEDDVPPEVETWLVDAMEHHDTWDERR